MPHQCTNCGRAFEDGSKEMLSGCPNCGGNKFQFRPATSDSTDQQSADRARSSTQQRSPAEQGSSAPQSQSDTKSAASGESPDRSDGTTDQREWPNTPEDVSPSERSESAEPASGPATEQSSTAGTGDTEQSSTPATGDTEDDAQASARADVVSKEELAASASTPPDAGDAPGPRSADAGDAPEPPDADGEVVEAPEATNPDLEELREELNQQFESIKIVAPGQYELNLMGLYDREEYIVSLQEDGRYVIEVPETWQGPGEEDD